MKTRVPIPDWNSFSVSVPIANRINQGVMWRKISNHKLITVAFLLGLCIVNGCVVSQQDTVSRRVNYDPYPSCLITNKLKVVVPPVADYAILSAEMQGGSRYPDEFWPQWNPDTNLVAEVLSQIPAFLKGPRPERLSTEKVAKLPGMLESLPKSVCQITGGTYKAQRALLLNFLPIELSSTRYWRETYYWSFDMGPRYWRVVYLLEDKKFTNLRISSSGY